MIQAIKNLDFKINQGGENFQNLKLKNSIPADSEFQDSKLLEILIAENQLRKAQIIRTSKKWFQNRCDPKSSKIQN